MRQRPDEATVQRVAALLRDGGVAALPADTLYGLAADSANRTAVERVNALKGKPVGTPVLVLAADLVPEVRAAEMEKRCI